jgi:AcrR family transcriptional regulator
MNRRAIRVGRPSKTEVQALGDHVVTVADGLFLENGYGGTSMALVALRARVGKQTLYRRYPDKAALFREVIRRRIDAIVAGSRGGIASKNPLNDLKRLGAAALNSALNPEFVRMHRIVIGEAMHFPELGSMAMDNWGSGFVDHCVAAIKRAQALGTCRKGDATAMAMSFMGALVGEPFHKALAGVVVLKHEADRHKHLNAMWRIFMDGVSTVTR